MTTATRALRALFAAIPMTSLSTARAISRTDVRVAIREARNAKRRVRVYSSDGFVPNSYKWRCQIQYVEGVKTEAGWKFTTGWTGAQRPRGRGNLIVVQ